MRRRLSGQMNVSGMGMPSGHSGGAAAVVVMIWSSSFCPDEDDDVVPEAAAFSLWSGILKIIYTTKQIRRSKANDLSYRCPTPFDSNATASVHSAAIRGVFRP